MTLRWLLRRVPTPPAFLTAAGNRRAMAYTAAGPGCRKWTPQLPVTEWRPMYPSVYRKRGPEHPVTLLRPDLEHVRVRVDLPGADPNQLILELRGAQISFMVTEDPNAMHGVHHMNGLNVGRSYEGRLLFHPSRLILPQDYTAELVNGILWFQIKCCNPLDLCGELNEPLVMYKDSNSEEEREFAYHPLVSDGLDRFYFFGYREDAFVLSVDMPGLTDSDLSLTVEGDEISFRAEEREKHPFEAVGDEPKRLYRGGFQVDTRAYNAQGTKAEIVRGVLWVEVPRHVSMPPGTKLPYPEDWVKLRFDELDWMIGGGKEAVKRQWPAS